MRKITTIKITFTAFLVALVLVNTYNVNVDAAPKKAERNSKVTKLLGAENLVNALFTDSSHTKIIPGLTHSTVDVTRTVVELLLPSQLKTDLLELLDNASSLLDARTEAEDAAKSAVDALYSNETHSQIKPGLVQTDIDAALNLADGLENEVLKVDLKLLINTSQLLLDNEGNESAQNQAAQDAVDALFTDGTHTQIKPDLAQVDIDVAKALVAVLSDGTLKTDLTNLINTAQDQLDTIIANQTVANQAAQDAVDALFSDGTHIVLKEEVSQADIDAAKALVDALNDSSIKVSLTVDINISQLLLTANQAAQDAVNALFTDETHTALNDGIVQADIDAAMELVVVLPNSSGKTVLLNLLETAQTILDEGNEVQAAQAAVDALFSDGTHTALKEDATQANIDAAKELVDALSDSSEKTSMLALLTTAQELKDNGTKVSEAQAAVDALFSDGTHTALKEDATQANIDAAKELVDALSDSSEKTSMLALLTTAQELKDNGTKVSEAQAAVDALFSDGTHTALKEDATQANIDAAKELVDALSDSSEKTSMLDLLIAAQELKDNGTKVSEAQAAVDALFSDGTHSALKEEVTQANIDAAKALVDALNDSSLKTSMLDLLTAAQELKDNGTKVSEAQAAVDALFSDENTYSIERRCNASKYRCSKSISRCVK